MLNRTMFCAKALPQPGLKGHMGKVSRVCRPIPESQERMRREGKSGPPLPPETEISLDIHFNISMNVSIKHR